MKWNLRCALAFALCGCLSACTSFRDAKLHRSLIVLGIDGMDPNFVERHWNVLPNLAKLRDQGYFGRLATTNPPQSPVAWSSFITGLDPADHGLFDFVQRNPRTLAPFSSMTRTEEPRWTLPLGPYIFPLSASRVISLRKGTPFWQTLASKGIPVTVMRMPTNYPPVAAGNALSGMGTPDLRGTLGTFTFYTDDPEELSHSVSGGRIVKVHLQEGSTTLPLEGPPNSASQRSTVHIPQLDRSCRPRCTPRSFDHWRTADDLARRRVVRLDDSGFHPRSASLVGSRHVPNIHQATSSTLRALRFTGQHRPLFTSSSGLNATTLGANSRRGNRSVLHPRHSGRYVRPPSTRLHAPRVLVSIPVGV